MLTIKLSLFYHVFLPKSENHFQGAKIVLSSLVGIWWQVAFTLPETNPANQYLDTYKPISVLFCTLAGRSILLGPSSMGLFWWNFNHYFFFYIYTPPN